MRTLAFVAVLACSSAAWGQTAQSAPVAIELQAPAPNVDPQQVQQEVARQLQSPVVTVAQAQPANPLRGTLAIFVTPEGQLTVRWRDTQGREVQRSVPAPQDPFEFVRTVGVLAANLANDQLSDLITSPVIQAQPAPPVVIQPPQPVVVQIAVTPRSVTAPMPVAPPVAPPVVSNAAPDWRELRARQRVSFGVDAYMTYVGSEFRVNGVVVESSHRVYSVGGLFVNWHARPWLRIGANQIMGGPIDGVGRGAFVSAAPYAEFIWAPARVIEVYGQTGLGLEAKFSSGVSFALAPQLTLGARFRIGDVFSLSIGARSAYSLVGDFVHSISPTPQGNVVTGLGTEIGWTL
ncbi:MAG: hypothetical protein U0269_29510 [Polyangiales bacterium]